MTLIDSPLLPLPGRLAAILVVGWTVGTRWHPWIPLRFGSGHRSPWASRSPRGLCSLRQQVIPSRSRAWPPDGSVALWPSGSCCGTGGPCGSWRPTAQQSCRAGRRFSSSSQGHSDALIDTGPFAVVRNPLYVGLIALDVAVALLAQSFWALVFAPIGVVALSWGAIRPEERYLSGKFGSEYQAYRARVRRWL